MYNKHHVSKATSLEPKYKTSPQPLSTSKKSAYLTEMKMRASKRREMKLSDQISSMTLIPSVYQGSIPLLHPIHHKFRDTDPTKFMGPKTMMNFTHLPAAERARLAQQKHKDLAKKSASSSLSSSIEWWLKEEHRVKAAHDNERVADAIAKNPKVNLEQINTKMMYFHDFRTKEPQKWMSERDLLAWERSKRRSWDMVNNYTPMPYRNGFDENILIRERDKTKEVADTIFSSVIPKDVWKNRVLQDQSIRAYKSLELKYATVNPDKKEESPADLKEAMKSSKNFYGSHNKQYVDNSQTLVDEINRKKIYFQSLYGYFPPIQNSTPKKSGHSEINTSKGSATFQHSPSIGLLRSPKSMRANQGLSKTPEVIASIVKEYLLK